MVDLAIPNNWAPRDYQMPLWTFMEGGGKRGVAVWHRRAGKDLMAINWCAVSAVQRTGLYWHLLPTYNQGRKIVWDGFTKDGRSFLSHFPEQLISRKNDTDMKITLKTGSIYQVVGTDDPDRLVGANPVGCIFSEYSLQDPEAWNLIRPILAENGGWALFIYTARGRNHGYDMLNMARKNSKWFSEVLTVDDTNSIPEDAIQDERDSGMPEEMIQQEFYCSFDAPIVGAYYGNQMMQALEEQRITKVPWEPRLQVHTAWDLGMADTMCIWFYQVHGMEIRLIDYYQNSGEGLAHYAKILSEKKDYVYGKHYAPHDIEVRELGTGKSRYEVARSLGIRFTVVPLHEVEDGIEAVRNMIPRCWFDEEKCSRGIEALRSYRKDYDEKLKTFRGSPLHDWSSHPSDAFRILAWGLRDRPKHQKAPQREAISEYSVLGS